VTTDGIDQPVPLPVPGGFPASAVHAGRPGVSDEERNRYGVLLDHAAERGLLSPAEYQARLGDLAEASSVEELQRIVTELPAFGATGATGTSRSGAPWSPGPAGTVGTRGAPDPAALDSALWANLTPARRRRGSGNPWMILAIVVVVFLVALVALAVVAAHVSHTHHTASAGPAAAGFSRLHL